MKEPELKETVLLSSRISSPCGQILSIQITLHTKRAKRISRRLKNSDSSIRSVRNSAMILKRQGFPTYIRFTVINELMINSLTERIPVLIIRGTNCNWTESTTNN